MRWLHLFTQDLASACCFTRGHELLDRGNELSLNGANIEILDHAADQFTFELKKKQICIGIMLAASEDAGRSHFHHCTVILAGRAEALER